MSELLDDPVNPVPPESDDQFPIPQPIRTRDRVAPPAANRQHVTMRTRTVALRNKVNEVAEIINKIGSGASDNQDFYLPRDGSLPMLSDLDMDGNLILNVPEPIDPGDVASKGYVDGRTQHKRGHFVRANQALPPNSTTLIPWNDAIPPDLVYLNVVIAGGVAPTNSHQTVTLMWFLNYFHTEQEFFYDVIPSAYIEWNPATDAVIASHVDLPAGVKARLPESGPLDATPEVLEDPTVWFVGTANAQNCSFQFSPGTNQFKFIMGNTAQTYRITAAQVTLITTRRGIP